MRILDNYSISFLKTLKPALLVSVFAFFLFHKSSAQQPIKFADKKYYLIDSLVLEELSETDKFIIDSCLKVYHKEKNDTLRILAINTIVEQSWDDNVWPRYNSWTLKLLKNRIKQDKYKRFYLKRYANALNNEGLAARNKGQLEIAFQYYNECLKIQKEQKLFSALATTYNNIGMIYMDYGDIEKALDYYFESLRKEEQYGDSFGVAVSLNNIGYVYFNQNNQEKALEYFNKSLNYMEALGDQSSASTILNNIGGIYMDFGDPQCKQGDCKESANKKAIEYFEKGLLIQQDIKDHAGIARSYNNIGMIFLNRKEYDVAMDYFNKSLVIREEQKDKNGLVHSLISISKIHLEQKDLTKAKSFVRRAMDLSNETQIAENIKDAANLSMLIAQKEGNWKEAFEFHKLYITMRDSMINLKNEKATLSQQSKYQFEKAQAIKDLENQKIVALANEEKARQKIITYAVAFIGLIIVVFSVLLWKRLKITQEQKQIIDEANEELNQTNEEILAQRDQIEHQKDIIQEKHTQLEASIRYAKRIQQAILPKDDNLNGLLPEHFILFKPRDIVSGDFYWADLKEDFLYIATADCTGHGVPGAFLSMLGLSFLNQINRSTEILSPAEILGELRKNLVRELKQEGKENETRDGMDIALIRLNLKTLELEYAGAYNPLYVINPNRTELSEHAVPFKTSTIGWEIKATKRPVGIAPGRAEIPFENHKVQLIKGDFVCIFSDGFADQFGGGSDQKYTYTRFKESLVNHYSKSSDDIKLALEEDFANWKRKADQTDDVCIIGVKI